MSYLVETSFDYKSQAELVLNDAKKGLKAKFGESSCDLC